MRRTDLLRYVYSRKSFYLSAMFLFTAAFSCGVFFGYGKGMNIVEEPFSLSIGALILYRLLPIAFICLGGLFFAGTAISVTCESCFAFQLGVNLGKAFLVSFSSGAVYLFLDGVPCGLLYTVVGIISAAEAFCCNFSRLALKLKGREHLMTRQEISSYFRRSIGLSAITVGVIILEKCVFGEAFLKISSNFA